LSGQALRVWQAINPAPSKLSQPANAIVTLVFLRGWAAMLVKPICCVELILSRNRARASS
jgi:hypothetical protein